MNRKRREYLFLAFKSGGAFFLTLFALNILATLFNGLPALALGVVWPLLALELLVCLVAIVLFVAAGKRT